MFVSLGNDAAWVKKLPIFAAPLRFVAHLTADSMGLSS